MKSIQEILLRSSAFLESKGIDRARRLAEDWVAHVLSCRRIDLYLQFDRPLEDGELDRIREGLKRLARHEPIDYLIGEVPFFGGVFSVDRRALIPRVETELLVEKIAFRIQEPLTVWDLCTGSGCIGISLKKKFPFLNVILSDISEGALQLAEENRKKNGVDVEIVKGDFLTPLKGRQVDFLICNPPYVTEKEYEELDVAVRDFEPKEALVGGKEGVFFYEKLALEAPSYLKKGGCLFLEIGASQGERVKQIFQTPDWKEGIVEKDLSGKDRFFFLEKQ